jgi:hypothetical protein
MEALCRAEARDVQKRATGAQFPLENGSVEVRLPQSTLLRQLKHFAIQESNRFRRDGRTNRNL